MANLLRALRYYRADTFRILGVIGLLILGVVAGLLRPWPLSILVDHFLGGKTEAQGIKGWTSVWVGTPQQGMVVMVGLAFLAYAFQALISALQNYLSIGISLRGLARVRLDLLARLQRLSWRFHQKMPSGDLIYRASWDTYAFQTLFQQGLMTLLTALLSLALMFLVMVQIDLLLATIALGTAPVLLLVIRLLGPAMSQRGKLAQESDSEVSSRVQQTIHLLPLIQSYTRETYVHGIFQRLADLSRTRRLSQHAAELRYGAAVALTFAASSTIILWVGGNRVLEGQLTVGQLLIFLAYLTQFQEPLSQLSHVGATLATAGAGTQRVFEILDEPQEVPNSRAPKPLPSLRSVTPGSGPWELEFAEVSFAYQQGHPVIRDVSFKAQQGDVIAIIGPSGAGKSTLLHMIPRFFDPSSGAIRLAGIDLRELRRDELRGQIALLLQEPLLVQGTIRENIEFGRLGASQQDIENAARSANAHDFILRLPGGYDTLVGEGAARLSVGEKQRINLARAFLKDAPILLLDEPTSALDRESEALVIESLILLMKGRTTFMVAHRLATIQAASKVLVIRDGTVAEFGTTQELQKLGGYFAQVNAGV
jgi:ATP-binding cassette subfamily B protein